jgi:hypothetical protein
MGKMEVNEIYQARGHFYKEYIPFPAFKNAIDAIEDNLAFFRETKIANHLLIFGESGAGKSSICEWFELKYPKIVLKDRDITPVLNVEVPSGSSVTSIASAILEALGDPAAAYGTSYAKTSRIITLCRACQVEMILFDEAQHVSDRGQATTHYMVGDWLKSLIDKIGVPTILLGLPRLELLLRVNEQLRRRFSRGFSLALGQSDQHAIHSECLQLFRSLGSCLPVPLISNPWGWDELGMRLYYASDGRIGYIKELLNISLRLALEADIEEIGPPLLERAFVELLKGRVVDQLNPFNSAFEFRRLDRIGEPFESGNVKTTRKY